MDFFHRWIHQLSPPPVQKLGVDSLPTDTVIGGTAQLGRNHDSRCNQRADQCYCHTRLTHSDLTDAKPDEDRSPSKLETTGKSKDIAKQKEVSYRQSDDLGQKTIDWLNKPDAGDA